MRTPTSSLIFERFRTLLFQISVGLVVQPVDLAVYRVKWSCCEGRQDKQETTVAATTSNPTPVYACAAGVVWAIFLGSITLWCLLGHFRVVDKAVLLGSSSSSTYHTLIHSPSLTGQDGILRANTPWCNHR